MLVTEMFKVHRDLSLPIFKVFNKRTLNYELRHLSQIIMQRVESDYNLSKNTPCLGPRIGNIVPSKLKYISIGFLRKQWNDFLETVRVDYVRGT